MPDQRPRLLHLLGLTGMILLCIGILLVCSIAEEGSGNGNGGWQSLLALPTTRKMKRENTVDLSIQQLPLVADYLTVRKDVCTPLHLKTSNQNVQFRLRFPFVIWRSNIHQVPSPLVQAIPSLDTYPEERRYVFTSSICRVSGIGFKGTSGDLTHLTIELIDNENGTAAELWNESVYIYLTLESPDMVYSAWAKINESRSGRLDFKLPSPGTYTWAVDLLGKQGAYPLLDKRGWKIQVEGRSCMLHIVLRFHNSDSFLLTINNDTPLWQRRQMLLQMGPYSRHQSAVPMSMTPVYGLNARLRH